MNSPTTSLSKLLELRSPSTSVRSVNGELYYYSLQNWQRFSDYEGRIDKNGSEPFLFFGLGSRSRAERLLDFGSGHRLYEPDPRRLKEFLDRHREVLRERQWKLGCGLHFASGFFSTPFSAAVHPLYRQQYAPLPQNLVHWSSQANPDEELIFVQVGALFYRDVIEALSDQNQCLFPFNSMNWKPAGLYQQFSSFPGSRFFSINLIEGLPAVAARADLDYICWEIDPATSPIAEIRAQHAEHTSVFTYRRRNIDHFQQAGYETVNYLPLAANPGKRSPVAGEEIESEYQAEVSFVGSSLKANADRLLNLLMRWLNRREQDYPEADWSTFRRKLNNWISEFPAWGEDTLPRLREQVAQLGIPQVIEFENETYSLPMILAEYRAFRKRLDVIRSAGDSYELAVWGDDGWEGQTGRQGNFCGEAAHEEELTKIYNGSKINLDVNRIYQPEIITMRVFDVMACGQVVLTEESDALRELFTPGEECVIYTDRADLVEKLDYYLDHDEERREIGRRAREKILAEHTIRRRLDHMKLITPD